MVEVEALAPGVKGALEAWVGCVAGTIPVSDYRSALAECGFVDLDIEVTRTMSAEEAGLPPGPGKIASAYIRARKPAA